MVTDPILSFYAREALMQQLDDQELKKLMEGNDFDIARAARRILKYRNARKRAGVSSRRLNYPIEEVLDDYLQQRTGKLVEAKRQLRKRFDGLDHTMQEKVMMAFMEQGLPLERDFIYGKLYGEGFWTDAYIPLIQKWWEKYQDFKMAKVIVKYCPREYILAHLEELEYRCNYATLCLRTGLVPDPERLQPWAYLYVLKASGRQLRPNLGEELVLKQIWQYLHEDTRDGLLRSIYVIPYVRRMMAYLGEMGMTEDILAIDAFEKRMAPVNRDEWRSAVIKAIGERFDFPVPFIGK